MVGSLYNAFQLCYCCNNRVYNNCNGLGQGCRHTGGLQAGRGKPWLKARSKYKMKWQIIILMLMFANSVFADEGKTETYKPSEIFSLSIYFTNQTGEITGAN